MLIDLLSQSNYNQYNINLAKVIGLHPAIYVNVLLSINSKAIQKQKITNEEYFTVDRNYITSITTFSIEEQKSIEKLLTEIGILNINESASDSTFFLDVSALTTIMMNPDESLLTTIKKIIKNKNTKRTKTDVIKDELKSYITATNMELKEAYEEWIDCVVAKQGWMAKKSVISAQPLIDQFSGRNLDVALKVIEIAQIGGFRDMTWAINDYKKNYNIQYRVPQLNVHREISTIPQPVETSTEEF